MKHIKRQCPFCHEIFYTETKQIKFCKPEHMNLYHSKIGNVKLSIKRTEFQIEKYKRRLAQRKAKLKNLLEQHKIDKIRGDLVLVD